MLDTKDHLSAPDYFGYDVIDNSNCHVRKAGKYETQTICFKKTSRFYQNAENVAAAGIGTVICYAVQPVASPAEYKSTATHSSYWLCQRKNVLPLTSYIQLLVISF